MLRETGLWEVSRLALKPHSAQGTTGERGRGAWRSPIQAPGHSSAEGWAVGDYRAQEGRTTGPWEHGGHNPAELRTHLAPSQCTDRAGFSKGPLVRTSVRLAGERRNTCQAMNSNGTKTCFLKKPLALVALRRAIKRDEKHVGNWPGFAPGAPPLSLAFSLDLVPTVFVDQLRVETRSSSSHNVWLERQPPGPWSARAVSQKDTQDPQSLLQRWTQGQQALVKTEGILQKPLRESCLSRLQTSALFSLVLEN